MTANLASGANSTAGCAGASPATHKSGFELALQFRQKHASRADKPLLVETKQSC